MRGWPFHPRLRQGLARSLHTLCAMQSLSLPQAIRFIGLIQQVVVTHKRAGHKYQIHPFVTLNTGHFFRDVNMK